MPYNLFIPKNGRPDWSTAVSVKANDSVKARELAIKRMLDQGWDAINIERVNGKRRAVIGRICKRRMHDEWYVLGTGDRSYTPYGWVSMRNSQFYELGSNGRTKRRLNIHPRDWH